jgi:hypothetical protein
MFIQHLVGSLVTFTPLAALDEIRRRIGQPFY